MWIKPSGQQSSNVILRVFNSLTKCKDELIPINGKILTWYCCGPTVYDSAHLGHARAYITFDIIRRIITDYFGYTVNYVMNITDIDDKIILKARQRHLLLQARERLAGNASEVKSLLSTSLLFYIGKKFDITTSTAHDSVSSIIHFWKESKEAIAKKTFTDSEEEYKFKSHMAIVERCINLLDNWEFHCNSLDLTWDQIGDVVSLKLDDDFGSTVTNQQVFSAFAKFYENDFLQDMQQLNVLPPTVMTRVSEYVPEIITLTEGIIKNGYGYESEGSVYFDVAAFHHHNDHHYAKLRPKASADDAMSSKLVEESEGSLGSKLSGKRSPRDFALWKKSKPGEPMWESPWGLGRPGWHIECSAMASSVIPGSIDVHSGGIDLAFPHHDNEMAQSEAFYDCKQWVNYFLHAGHLNIEGQKMSKSLKNFITIKEALKKYSARQIRIMFLQHSWSSLLDFKESSLNNAIAFESSMNTFFANIKAHISDDKNTLYLPGKHNYNEEEKILRSSYDDTVNSVHVSLSDSFDTPAVMNSLNMLMGKVNVYIREKAGRRLNLSLLEEISQFIFRILKVFGLFPREQHLFASASGENSIESMEKEKLALAKVISDFRFKVRSLLANDFDKKQMFTACDELRDKDLFKLGIILEDRDGQPSLVKIVDQIALFQIQEEREKEALSKQVKPQSSSQLTAKRLEKLEKAKVKPDELFKNNVLYSAYDERGIPTHNCNGEELSKNQRKKLIKEYEQQVANYNQFISSQQ